MQRLVVWILLGVAYGGVLAVLVQFLGQPGILVWLVLVAIAQLLLSRWARGT